MPQLPPGAVLLPVLHRREALEFAELFGEVGLVGDADAGGDFADAEAGAAQEFFGLVDAEARDVLREGESVLALEVVRDRSGVFAEALRDLAELDGFGHAAHHRAVEFREDVVGGVVLTPRHERR